MTAQSAAQTASPPKTSRVNVVFPVCATTSPYDVRKTTKYVQLVRTIEKRKFDRAGSAE